MSTTDTTCTCPSGDGSLRWPCPTHPPTERDERPQDFVGRLIEHERIERLGEARLAADHLCDGRDTLGLPERAKAVVLALDAEITRLDAVVTTVRNLHKRNPLWDDEAEKAAGYNNTDDMCVECWDDWPCDTVKILDGGA